MRIHLKSVRFAWLMLALSATPVAAADPAGSVVEAVKARNHQAIRALLDRHANVNAREADGTTPLHWAVRVDDPESVQLLLRAGADVNVANRSGVTPWMLGRRNGGAGWPDAWRGAGRVAPQDWREGRTCLMRAARPGDPAVIKAWIALGANVNAPETWLERR